MKTYGPFDLASFRIGDRVELHPATDHWMRGDRYGVVMGAGNKTLRVTMDTSGRALRVAPDNIHAIVE